MNETTDFYIVIERIIFILLLRLINIIQIKLIFFADFSILFIIYFRQLNSINNRKNEILDDFFFLNPNKQYREAWYSPV